MGNFVSVMVDEPALDRIVGSRDRSQLPAVRAACSGLETERAKKLALAERLIDGEFTAEEQPDAPLFVYLFQDVCRAVARHKTTEEIYVDEDQFPEMWEFVWDAGETRFGLPLSPHGSPAVGYWDGPGVKRFIATFAGLDQADLEERAGKAYTEEMARLLEVLEAAEREARGVFVFLASSGDGLRPECRAMAMAPAPRRRIGRPGA